MIRIGLLANPRSHGHRRGRDMAALARGAPEIAFAAPETRAELAAALAGFARAEVSLIAVSGGDGTLREVLTALPAAYGGAMPDLALLPAGRTNVAARDVGAAGAGAAGLAWLGAVAAGRARPRVTERPILEVARVGDGAPPLRGFLVGFGAYAAATGVAEDRILAAGIHRGPAVALSIAVVAAGTVLGPARRRLAAGVPLAVARDGGVPVEGRRFLFLASTLERLMLGIWPFWGEGPGVLRWLDIAAPPRRLASALMPVLRGRPRPWMAEAGYTSGRAAAVAVECAEPFVVDGETYSGGRLVLAAPARARFLAP